MWLGCCCLAPSFSMPTAETPPAATGLSLPGLGRVELIGKVSEFETPILYALLSVNPVRVRARARASASRVKCHGRGDLRAWSGRGREGWWRVVVVACGLSGTKGPFLRGIGGWLPGKTGYFSW